MRTSKTAAKKAPKITATKAARRAAAAAPAPEAWAPKRRGLMLRTCAEGMRPHYQPTTFVWPSSGYTKAPDWSKSNACGRGLHGLLWGEGDGSQLCADQAKHWLVVEVDLDEVVDLGGKVKAPQGNVVHCGDQASATAYMAEHGEKGHACAYGTSTSGYGGTSTSGDGGSASSGELGTISILFFDEKRGKYRLATAEVGENGIEPDTYYVLDAAHRFVKHATLKHPKTGEVKS